MSFIIIFYFRRTSNARLQEDSNTFPVSELPDQSLWDAQASFFGDDNASRVEMTEHSRNETMNEPLGQITGIETTPRTCKIFNLKKCITF